MRKMGSSVAYDALDVSLDYLVGATSFVVKDEKMLHRRELLDKIDEDDRETILSSRQLPHHRSASEHNEKLKTESVTNF